MSDVFNARVLRSPVSLRDMLTASERQTKALNVQVRQSQERLCR